jgi:hypothetical protein
MIQEPLESKSCCDCGLSIPFTHFRAINPSLSMPEAKELYENPLIDIYCPTCYFQRPEKPYKNKRRAYYNKFSYHPKYDV